MPTLEDLRPEYERLFNNSQINASKFAEIDGIANTIITSKARYEAIGKPLNVPWFFIGILHNMECGLKFTKHLHNGDPLTARTVQVPKGRPKTGNPPFTFEESAKDALVSEGFTSVTDWSVAGLLFQFEKYNGFGYRKASINIPSPYLWSYSNHYTKGKFATDGKYDPNLVSKQPGTASILRRLSEKQAISFGDQQLNRIKAIKQLGETVLFKPNVIVEDARSLQILLNEVGFPLLRDGKAGEGTSNAYKQVSGKFLNGDPRRKN
jgi:lysozyme family protein